MGVRITATLLAVAAGVATAEEPPPLRAGMWEFTRTVEVLGTSDQRGVLTTSKCANPSQDMKGRNQQLSAMGCKVSPMTRSGSTYTFTAECTIKGVAVHSKSVLTVESATAYTVRVESRSSSGGTNETLKARRTGDCEK